MIPPEGVHGVPAAKLTELRRRALDLVAQAGPVVRGAKDLGITESCLRRSIDVDAVDAGRGEAEPASKRRTWSSLHRRNRALKTKLQIRERASAYFASDNVLPRQ